MTDSTCDLKFPSLIDHTISRMRISNSNTCEQKKKMRVNGTHSLNSKLASDVEVPAAVYSSYVDFCRTYRVAAVISCARLTLGDDSLSRMTLSYQNLL